MSGFGGGVSGFMAIRPERFTPAKVPGLALWLDAAELSTITLSGTAVTQWSDKSGKGLHATQGTAASQPQLSLVGLNGRAAVVFDGGDRLSIDGGDLIRNTEDATLFVVARSDSEAAMTAYAFAVSVGDLPGSARLWFGEGLNAGRAFVLARRLDSDNGVNLSAPAEKPHGKAPHVWEVCVSWAQNALTLRQDGEVVAASAPFATTGATSDTAPALQAVGGREPGSSGRWQGAIGEMLLFESDVSEEDRQRVTRYLSTKWGVPLQ